MLGDLFGRLRASEVHDAVFLGIRSEIVFLGHPDAIDGARRSTEIAEEALGVVDVELGHHGVFATPHGLNVDAVHGAGRRAHIAGDANFLIESVNPAMAGRDVGPLFGVHQRDRTTEKIPHGDTHPTVGRHHAELDVAEVFRESVYLGYWLGHWHGSLFFLAHSSFET